MQIKSYNPSVDPNTIHGNVQAPSDSNAYGWLFSTSPSPRDS